MAKSGDFTVAGSGEPAKILVEPARLEPARVESVRIEGNLLSINFQIEWNLPT